MEKAAEISEIEEIIERPRVCCFDIAPEVVSNFQELKMNVFDGSLGKAVKVPKKDQYSFHELLLNHTFPVNFHEYDICIVDLHNTQKIDFNSEHHSRKNISGKSTYCILSSYPESLFNPRPLAASLLRKELAKITKRQFLLIVFTTSEYSVEYEPVKIVEGRSQRLELEEYNIYSFLRYFPLGDSISGEEIRINKVREDISLNIS